MKIDYPQRDLDIRRSLGHTHAALQRVRDRLVLLTTGAKAVCLRASTKVVHISELEGSSHDRP